jgi:hypothetical protein
LYGVRSASLPTPNLDYQGIPFHLWQVPCEVPCSWLHYRQRSSQDPSTTQAPPLCQSKDTIKERV